VKEIFNRISGVALLALLRSLIIVSKLGPVRTKAKTISAAATKSENLRPGPIELQSRVAIVIPVFNNWTLTLNCLESIRRTPDAKFADIWVVDDASTDSTCQEIERDFPEVKIIRNENNMGFLLSCNAALVFLTESYEWVYLLNNDTIVKSGFLLESVCVAQKNPNAALVGSKLIYPDGTLQEAGGIFWSNGNAWNFGRNKDSSNLEFNIDRQVDYCSGAALLLNSAAIRRVGFFSTEFLPAYCEDSDLAFKLRQDGFETWYSHKSVVIHLEGMSHGRDSAKGTKAYQAANLKKFEKKWREVLNSHLEENPSRSLDAAFRLSPALQPRIDKFEYLRDRVAIPEGLLPLLNRLSNFYFENKDRKYTDLLFRQKRIGGIVSGLSSSSTANLPPAPSQSILLIDHDIPRPDTNAGDLLTYSYIQLLRNLGKNVVFFPACLPNHDRYYSDLISLGVHIPDDNVSLENWLKANGKTLDRVWVARPEIAAKAIRSIRKYSPAAIAYFTHDLHHLRLRTQARVKRNLAVYLSSVLMSLKEKKIFNSVDLILSVSKEETDYITAQGVKRLTTTLVPFFLSEEPPLARNSESFAQKLNLVFLGGYRHQPNKDAAFVLANRIMPIIWETKPNAILTLAGSFPDSSILSLAGARVVVPGQVENLKELFDENCVFVAPLRFGAGVKGKTLEAMKLGIPVVGTPVAFQGIPIQNGREALVGENEKEIADLTLHLFDSPLLCELLSKNALEFLKREYSVEEASKSLVPFLQMQSRQSEG
jgi:GT2 family glycosyltransferase